MSKKIAVFTGAGISEESGITTFRDSGGIWDKYDFNLVATVEGWKKDKQYVLDFYNDARKLIKEVEPNKAHFDLVKLEEKHQVQIITQNVDDLHERAGSTNVLHLHGQIFKSRSELNESITYDCYGDLRIGDVCPEGSQLRPHIVWFGEAVPEIQNAIKIIEEADILIVIGTSLQVYPAANLINIFDQYKCSYLVDPSENLLPLPYLKHIQEKASVGVEIVVEELL